jgi:chorismate mutase-like protein
MTDSEPTLAGLRGEIDRLDDELVDMLMRRTQLVQAIGSLKGADGSPVLRPGREAEILRRLLARAGGGLDGAAVVRIFREIVSAAVRQQGSFSVAASMPDAGPSCWALARDQYGAATPIMPMAGAPQVAAAVAAGTVSIGIVPTPVSEEPQPWWPPLMAANAPRVVARLPAAEGLAPTHGCTEGFALALMTPEASGDDRSLVALEIEKGLGRSRVRDGLEAAGFVIGSTWSHSAGERDRHDGYLTEVDGFVVPESPALAALDKVLDGAVQHVAVIGSFAVPPRVGAGPASGTPLTGPDV